MRKNVCFWCIFGRWIQIYFQNLSITHIFRSRLKGWNLLRQDIKVWFYLNAMTYTRISSSRKMVSCFAMMFVPLWKFLVMNRAYNPDQWRLFIDSSKVSLKMVIFHNGNRFSSVPSAHAANTKGRCESMKLLLGKITYDEFKWKLCGYFKVVALLLGVQLGYTKYCCFLCEWDIRDKKNHYVNKL